MTSLKETSQVEKKPSDEDWEYEHIPHFMNGIELLLTPRLIPKTSCLQAENVRLESGQVLRDFGYAHFGAAVRGAPRRAFQWQQNSGVSLLILITDSTVYKWNTSETEWQYISDGTSTTLNGGEPTSETAIAVNSISGFSDGDHVGIILDDGTEHQTTINGAPSAGVITITDGLPSAAGNGNALVKSVDLTGSVDIPVSVDAWPATDKLYFTNGVDAPKEYDGTDITTISNLPGTTFICKVVQIFSNRLLLMNTTEDGTARPYRVRWSNVGVDNNFNASVNFNDLFDHPDAIQTAEKLGVYNIIYKETSITRMEFVGTEDQTFDFITTIDDEGAISGASVVNIGDRHILCGNKNIYAYDGTFELNPVGDSIRDLIFGSEGRMNPVATPRIFGVEVVELQEVWFFYAAGADTDPKDVVRMNLELNAFTTRSFNDTFSGFGTYITTDTKAWNNLVGDWNDQVWNWNSRTILSNVPTLLLGGKGDLQIFQYDYVNVQDDGTDISYVFETKDFNFPNRELRFDRYDFLLKGDTILIEVSYDEGESFDTLPGGTVSSGGVYTKVTCFKQAIGDTVRFKFTGSRAFGLKYIGFRFKQENIG